MFANFSSIGFLRKDDNSVLLIFRQLIGDPAQILLTGNDFDKLCLACEYHSQDCAQDKDGDFCDVTYVDSRLTITQLFTNEECSETWLTLVSSPMYCTV